MAEKQKSKLPDGVEEFLAAYAPYMDSVAGSKPSEKYKPDQGMLERQHEMAMEFLNSMRRSGGSPSVHYSSGGGGGSPSMGGRGGYVPPPMETVTKPAITPATTPEVAAPPTDSYTFKREEPPKKAETKEDDEGGISPLLGLIPGALAGSWLWGKHAGKQARKFVIPWGDAQKQLPGKAPQKLLEGDGLLKNFEQQGTGKPMTPEDFLKYYMGKAASDKTPPKDVKDVGNLRSLVDPDEAPLIGGAEKLLGGGDSNASKKKPIIDIERRMWREDPVEGELLPKSKEPQPTSPPRTPWITDAEFEEWQLPARRGKTHLLENAIEGELLPKPKELQPTSPTKTAPITDAEFEEWQLPARRGKTPLLENAIEGELLPKPKELQPTSPTKTAPITDADFEEWQLPTKIKSKGLTSGSKSELKAPEGLPPELKQLEGSTMLENILRQLEELKGKFGDNLPMKDQKMASFGNAEAFQLSPEIKKMLSREKNMSTIKRMLEDMRNKGKK